jgi:hypothetical protein
MVTFCPSFSYPISSPATPLPPAWAILCLLFCLLEVQVLVVSWMITMGFYLGFLSLISHTLSLCSELCF